MRSTKRQLASLAAALMLTGLLSACGQKGPLFMPEPASQDAQEETDKKSAKAAKRG